MNKTASFGQWLRSRRKALDLTQIDLARRVGLSSATVRKLESDERRPSRHLAERLAQQLDIPLEDRPAFVALARVTPAPASEEATTNPAPAIRPEAAPTLSLQRQPRTTLPLPSNPLLGREREVADVVALLQRGTVRLLTLTGPGGIGKTRLAIEVARELADTLPSGVVYVPLAALADPAMVPTEIIQAFGIREMMHQSSDDVLREYLRPRNLLLVLDNFEHIVSAAPLLTMLLATAPALKLLVTSRTRLHLSFEHEYVVPALDVDADPSLLDAGSSARPEPQTLQSDGTDEVAQPARTNPTQDPVSPAVALFEQRARALQPDFELTSATAPAVAEICRRVDGLPLAIELVASRIKLLSPPAMLSRLHLRSPLLSGGARDLPPRQQSLHQTLDWSYDLLAPDEQRLFRRLGVFMNGCTLPAAEAVCSDEPEQQPEPAAQISTAPAQIFTQLAALVDESLLHYGRSSGPQAVWAIEERSTELSAAGEPRFAMLRIMHEYALERLTEYGEVAHIQQRHASYFLQLVETAEPELLGSRQGDWLIQLAAEHDNLRVALQWARDHNNVEFELRLATALWLFWRQRGYWSEGRSCLENALQRGTTAAPTLRARALYQIGSLACIQHDLRVAAAVSDEALALSRKVGDERGVGWALNNLGLVALDRGDYSRSVQLQEESLAAFHAIDDRFGAAVTLNSLGEAATLQGDYARAATFHQESYELLHNLGNWASAVWPLIDLGRIAILQGDIARAMQLLDESLHVFRSLADSWGMAWALNHLAWTMRVQAGYARARELIRESLQLFEEMADTWGIASSLSHLAWIALGEGDLRQAYTDAARSLTLFQHVGGTEGILGGLEVLAAVASAQDQPVRSLRILGAVDAVRASRSMPRPPVASAPWQQTLDRAHVDLDPASFASAWEAGRSLSLDQAIIFALDRDTR